MLCAVVAGAVALTVADRFRPELQAWVAADPRNRIRIVVGVVAVFTAGPVIAMAAYLWRFGHRLRVERPDDRRGLWMQAYAAAMIAAGVLLAFVLFRLMP